jgi:serine/threonine-protein kinase
LPPAPPPRPWERPLDDKFAGNEYVWEKILNDVRRLKPGQIHYWRYFTLNHLAAAGATLGELELHRRALAKAVNHLSRALQPFKLRAVDPPDNLVFAVDLREVEWLRQPLTRIAGRRDGPPAVLKLFDLLLLEYPYAVVPKDSRTFDQLAEEFLVPAKQIRPVAALRADWFVSVATQPPLYAELLQLPGTLEELEESLGVRAAADVEGGTARRAGVRCSGETDRARVVERHPFRYKRVLKNGAYWKAFDGPSGAVLEDILRDPVNLKWFGGAALFSLQNGLYGYLRFDAGGRRSDAADRWGRNGLSCLCCHATGIRRFTDEAHAVLARQPGIDRDAALRLYPTRDEMNDLLEEDANRFAEALTRVLGRRQDREPLGPVSRRFLDELDLRAAAAELGFAEPVKLAERLRAPALAALGLAQLAEGRTVRRDAWEDVYGRAAHALRLGTPVIPLDGLTHGDFPAGGQPFAIALKTNRSDNIFDTGEKPELSVVNDSERPLFIELIRTNARGEKALLTSAPVRLPPGETYRLSPEAQAKLVPAGSGKVQVTLFAADEEFPGGELLRGKELADRVVHRFYTLADKFGKRIAVGFEPTRFVKRTLEVEIR